MNSLPSDEEKPSKTRAVLDSSALLALAQGEPGASDVRQALLDGAAISAVNLAETYTKLVEAGGTVEESAEVIAALGPEIIEFDQSHAALTARLRPITKYLGLSLGDRACLALALWLGVPALTGDRKWIEASIGVQVKLIR